MSHLIGRGRYARETYPSTGQGPGPGGLVVPLTRTKFIDAGSVGATENGAAVNSPYKSIASFLAAIGTPTSTADADLPICGFVSPGAYPAALAIPARRNVVLRAQGLNSSPSAPIGAITWANVSGPNPPTTASILTLDSLVVPSITITDNNVVDSSLFLVASNGISEIGPIDGGTGATRFVEMFVDGAVIFTGSINAPHATIEAINGAEFQGNGSTITCQQFGAFGTAANGCLFSGAGLTINAANGGFFTDCFFGAAVTLAGNSTFLFDDLSYASWLAAGGMLNGTTKVEVVGMADLNRVQAAAAGSAAAAAGYAALTAPSILRVASGNYRVRGTVTIGNLAGTLAAGDAVVCQLYRDAVAVGPVIVAPAVTVAGAPTSTVIALVTVEFEDASGKALGVGTVYTLKVTSSNTKTSGVVAGEGEILVSELPN